MRASVVKMNYLSLTKTALKNYGKCLQYCYCKHVSDETQGPTFVYGTQSVIVNFAIHGTNKSTVSTSNTIIFYTLYEFDI